MEHSPPAAASPAREQQRAAGLRSPHQTATMGVDALLKDPVGQRYHWVTNGEPHSLRRREILSKYGDQIRKLYGYDHATAWQVSDARWRRAGRPFPE